ncbi:MAG: transglycosylase SLT domain-containing protein [Bdellovibrionota bacterium]
MQKALRSSFLIAVIFYSGSCTDDLNRSQLEITPEENHTPASTMAEEQLKSLNKAVADSKDNAELVKDIKMLLEAKILEDQNNYKKAADQYFKAVKIADGKFGEKALHGWILNYTRSLEQKTKSTFISRILLDIAQNGAIIPYMKKKEITSIEKLNPIIQNIAGKYILPEDSESPLAYFPEAPKSRGIPDEDPLLSSTSELYCKGKGDPGYQWEAWIAGLEKSIQIYWNGMVATCKNEYGKSLLYFKKSLQQLSKSERTINLAVSSAYRIVKFLRYNAERQETADAYIDLIRSWKRKGLTAENMGMDKQEFELERINDHLWAARYRSLIGDYQSARIYSNDSLKLIAQSFTKTHLLDDDFREKLSDFKAEAYLILANRIAVEEKNFETAASQMLVATKIKSVSQQMKERLLWYAGFYQYLNKQLLLAIEKWQVLLNETNEDSTKAQSYFWIARTYSDLDKKEEAQEYLNLLISKYPLNYYSVIASKEYSKEGSIQWQHLFSDYQKLSMSLNDRNIYNEISSKTDQSLSNLIKRAEILIKARMGDWSKLAVEELDKPFKDSFDSKTYPEAFIYLSRLHYLSGNYMPSIIYTTTLAQENENFWQKWPEQVLIYFPTPYLDIFDRNAMETDIDKHLLLSISRQESAFNKLARSHANAYGLMQLIIPTAQKYAEGIEFEDSDLKDKLFEPEVSILIGSRYLKSLKLHYGGYLPGMLAAYNAGEYAVDTWLERRYNKDPLIWIELVPFGETRGYIKNVWRNSIIYSFLEQKTKYSTNTEKPQQARSEETGVLQERIQTIR